MLEFVPGDEGHHMHAHLVCRNCKELIFLGKWLRTEDNRGFGFWHGTLCPGEVADSLALGRKALRFIAAHMDHELMVISRTALLDSLLDDGYRDVDDEY